MRSMWTCRRTWIAFYAITSLAVLMYTRDVDTSTAIAAIAMGIAGANSAEKAMAKRK